MGQNDNLGEKTHGPLSRLGFTSQGIGNINLLNNQQKKWATILIDKDTKSEGEAAMYDAEPQNGSTNWLERMCVDGGHEIVKEEWSTQTFWERLVSDDELLQMRVETLAQV
ncbi:hypothetical protein SLA2020_121730 [Shorea laevis]